MKDFILEFKNEWTTEERKTFVNRYVLTFANTIYNTILILFIVICIYELSKDFELSIKIFSGIIVILTVCYGGYKRLAIRKKFKKIMQKVKVVSIKTEGLFLDDLKITKDYKIVLTNRYLIIRRKRRFVIILVPKNIELNQLAESFCKLDLNYKIFNKSFELYLYAVTGKFFHIK